MTSSREELPGYVEPRDTDPLHEQLQQHIEHCKQCSEAADTSKPRGFGQRSKMCNEYFNIVRLWSAGEYTREEDAKLRE